MIALVSIAATFRDVEELGRPPLGLLYVGDSLKKGGFEVEVFHISQKNIQNTVQKIIAKDPLFVGFSVLTGLPVKTSLLMSKKIKDESDSIIVWGGVHPSLLPEECLKLDYVDIVVIGEGEETVVDLANALEKKEDLRNIRGIGYKQNGKIIINERRPFIKDIDKYEMDWSLIDLKKYIRPMLGEDKGIYFVTSRGCPHNCGFCYNRVFNASRWRAHSKEYVISKLEQIKDEWNINAVSFDDDNFLANPKRAFDIMGKVDLPWWGELRIDYINCNILKNLRKTNCRHIFFGFESGNNRILGIVGKGFTKDKIIDGIRKLADYPEIGVDASGIVGFPTETKEEMKETYNLVLQMSKIHPNINFNIGLYIPYPGTDLYNLAIKEGFEPPETQEDWADYDILSGNFDVTWLRWATKKDIYNIRLSHEYASLMTGSIFGKYRKFLPVAFLHNFFLRKVATTRLEKDYYNFPYELKILLSIRKKIKNYKMAEKKDSI